MRIATYNVEWFDALFDENGRIMPDGEWSSRWRVTRAEQLDALGIVFTAMDADGVMIIEAPDTGTKRSSVKALENFAREYGLRATEAVSGFANDTQQEITFLYDPNTLSARHDPIGPPSTVMGPFGSPRFDRTYQLDLDIDQKPEEVRFSKPPLELQIETASGALLRMIGVHVKSKAPHGATNPDEEMRIAIQNRRKQLAQCIWIRNRVEEHLGQDESLIVLGDFNDGPGLDEYEKLFGRSGVSVVLGQNGAPALHDPHAVQALKPRIGPKPTSARFYIHEEKRYLSALLDYIMVSGDLCALNPSWRIWHPFDDAACYHTPELREALLTASDHFPVSLDITL